MRPPASLLPLLLTLACHKVPASLPTPVEQGSDPAGRDAPVFVESQPGTGESRLFTPISAEIAALYRCWFESPYPYMFAHDGEPLEVGGQRYGMLMAGISGILYYGDLNECAGRLVDTAPRSYSDIHPLELLAGVSATLPNQGLPFDAVNPEFVHWARTTLLPAPEQDISGISVQLAYDRVFQRFFRLMGESLFYLAEAGSIEVEARNYLRDVSNGQDGIEWLENRYSTMPGRLSVSGGSWDGTTMTAPMAAGFWLRRQLDGSLAVCWHALREVLERYDSVWLHDLRARDSTAASLIDTMPDEMPAGGSSSP